MNLNSICCFRIVKTTPGGEGTIELTFWLMHGKITEAVMHRVSASMLHLLHPEFNECQLDESQLDCVAGAAD